MAIDKLQIGKKEDNPTRIAQIAKAGLPAKQYLTAAESNAVVDKINEMIPEVNVGVSGFQGKIGINDIRTDIGFYFPEESGVYIHADNINVDISEGINHLLFDGEKWDKTVVPFEANGKVEKGDKSAVSGGTVFENNISLKKDEIKNKFFELYGYLAYSSGLVYEDNVRKSTPLLPIKEDTILNVHTTIPNIDDVNIATLVLYGEDKKTIIKKFKSNELLIVDNKDYHAVYFRACGDSRFDFYINYNQLEEITSRYNNVQNRIDTTKSNPINSQAVVSERSLSFFRNKGYVSSVSGSFLSDNIRLSTDFLSLKPNAIIRIKTTIPIQDPILNISNVVLYDINKKPIKYFNNNDEIIIDNKDYHAIYFRACGDSRFDFYIDYDAAGNNSYFDIVTRDIINNLPYNNSHNNNAWTQALSNNFFNVESGIYGGVGAVYKIKNKVTNGVVHLAFKFRINEDVNKSDGIKKPYVRFNAGEEFLEFYLLAKQPKQFEGGEQDNSKLNTRSPIPYYQSRFGVHSTFNKQLLNIEMNERGLKYQKGSSSVNLNSTKPLVGNDVFSIKIDAVDSNGLIISDTTNIGAQEVYEKWKDAYIEVTTSDFIIKNELLGFEKIYSLNTYKLVRNLFENVYRDLNGLIVSGAKFNVTGINVTPWNDHLTRDLLKHKYYISTQYSRLDGVRSFYDSFPIYFPLTTDESWHTFELVTTNNKDELYYCIDGQYMNIEYSNPQMVVTGVKEFMNKCTDITIGGGLNIQLRDLEYEYNEYSNVYTSRTLGAYDTVLFSSKLHPLVWNFFGHDVYHNNYSGGEYSLYTKLVSDGGKIPDELFYSDRNGDGTPHKKRVGLYQPSWQFESGLEFMQKTGFVFITHKEYVEYVKSGKAPHHRCCIIGFDDMPSYIYSNPELKRIFTKYGCKPYLALELGWYIDKEAPTKSYNALEWITENKDTNDRRLKLQRTLKSLQNDGWGIELHGAKEGFVFRGCTYNEMVNGVEEAVELANYLGIESSSWCIAGNYQTPNMIKLFQHRGIDVATSTVLSTSGKAFMDTYQPRTLMPSNLDRQRMYFPFDI